LTKSGRRSTRAKNNYTWRSSSAGGPGRTALLHQYLEKTMKIQVRVYSVSSDDDHGTNTALFSDEDKAVDALLNKLEISTTVQTEFKEYTRDQLKRFYFFPQELPATYEDFFELLNEIKDPANSYNIDEHLVEVEGPKIPFIERIADLTQDGEMLEDGDGSKYKFVLENDDAVSTLHALIDAARELVGRKDEDSQEDPPYH
jgi:hypothetical protein